MNCNLIVLNYCFLGKLIGRKVLFLRSLKAKTVGFVYWVVNFNKGCNFYVHFSDRFNDFLQWDFFISLNSLFTDRHKIYFEILDHLILFSFDLSQNIFDFVMDLFLYLIIFRATLSFATCLQLIFEALIFIAHDY